VSGRRSGADVIVVGAGPAGSTAATYLARAGIDVLLLEKTAFPREKVCGDALPPRGVKQLIDLGIDTSEAAGWMHSRGLRTLAGDLTVEFDWPDLTSYPSYGVARTRHDLDDLLAKLAVGAGARLLERTTVTGALTDDHTGRVVGVAARTGPEKTPVTFRAPLVLACDGVSARLALSVGIDRHPKRPLGVAARRYYRSPRHDDPYLEVHVDLLDRADPGRPRLLPGYGWAFPLGNGTVNVGVCTLTSTRFRDTDCRALLRRWVAETPEEWGYREENAVGPVRGAALPMGFSRTPHYRDGLLLLGDAGGMVAPLTGEGISAAMESAQLAAAAVIQALAQRDGPSRERVLAGYPRAVAELLGGYYQLSTCWNKVISFEPRIQRAVSRYGPRVKGMRPLLYKAITGCYDGRGGDLADRLIATLARLTPSPK